LNHSFYQTQNCFFSTTIVEPQFCNQTPKTAFLKNHNFNHSFYQTPIFLKINLTKSTFYETAFYKPQPQQQPQYQTRS
jgi:hypothetical protein